MKYIKIANYIVILLSQGIKKAQKRPILAISELVYIIGVQLFQVVLKSGRTVLYSLP